MSAKGFAPGWVARCSKCPYEVDLESLGWVRVNAYSWGKRHRIHCPDCGRSRWMRIIHVDENGEPDQPFGLVLKKVLTLQLLILAGLSLIFAFVSMAIWIVESQLGIDVLL